MVYFMIVIFFVLSLVFMVSDKLKTKYILWIIGLLFWKNYTLYGISDNPSMEVFFFTAALDIFIIPFFFIVSGLQTLIRGILKKHLSSSIISAVFLVLTGFYCFREYGKPMSLPLFLFWLGMLVSLVVLLFSNFGENE
ncbi:hypothetical protein IGI37_001412 [Enterococcus sp. AZ194]|uniref:hypothetical protein n=1 Tax=Enterococcus sp. AZ194 TaxID=2774629 RepID=UPI003F2788BE